MLKPIFLLIAAPEFKFLIFFLFCWVGWVF